VLRPAAGRWPGLCCLQHRQQHACGGARPPLIAAAASSGGAAATPAPGGSGGPQPAAAPGSEPSSSGRDAWASPKVASQLYCALAAALGIAGAALGLLGPQLAGTLLQLQFTQAAAAGTLLACFGASLIRAASVCWCLKVRLPAARRLGAPRKPRGPLALPSSAAAGPPVPARPARYTPPENNHQPSKPPNPGLPRLPPTPASLRPGASSG
jgi:hypothetical protein